MVRAEGIITELVFEHALRIRMKEEVENKTESKTPSEAGSVKPSTETGAMKLKEKVESKDPSSNLIGKINNMISSDLDTIVSGRDFLFATWYTPMQIIFCVCFLYGILGISALFGMASMVLCLPVPGYVAAKMNAIQKETMKATDSKVQSITESTPLHTTFIRRLIKASSSSKRFEDDQDVQLGAENQRTCLRETRDGATVHQKVVVSPACQRHRQRYDPYVDDARHFWLVYPRF